MKNWIQLSPYGTFNHPYGKQTIEIADAKRCVSKSKRLKLRLRCDKIPVYIGHPDDPLFNNPAHPVQHKVYGYVRRIAVSKEGLFVKIKWNRCSYELIANRIYTHLSPRWVLIKNAHQSTFHPIDLLSVGLTQQPNLPVAPIPYDEAQECLKKLRASKPQKAKSTLCWICALMKGCYRLLLWVYQQIRKGYWWLFQVAPDADSKSAPVAKKPVAKKPVAKKQKTKAAKTKTVAKPKSKQKVHSNNLHKQQTRGDKKRILDFSQKVMQRMQRTGENYPEAWSAIQQGKE